jgi:hypothetical protein
VDKNALIVNVAQELAGAVSIRHLKGEKETAL